MLVECAAESLLGSVYIEARTVRGSKGILAVYDLTVVGMVKMHFWCKNPSKKIYAQASHSFIFMNC